MTQISSNYRPFGPQYDASGTETVKYTGKREDSPTKLYYFGARYYDPELGRFTTQDPVLSVNQYIYANNNPNKYIDPDGRFIIPGAILGMAVGAVVGLAVEVSTSLMTGQPIDRNRLIVAVGVGAVSGFVMGGLGPAGFLVAGAARAGARSLLNHALGLTQDPGLLVSDMVVPGGGGAAATGAVKAAAGIGMKVATDQAKKSGTQKVTEYMVGAYTNTVISKLVDRASPDRQQKSATTVITRGPGNVDVPLVSAVTEQERAMIEQAGQAVTATVQQASAALQAQVGSGFDLNAFLDARLASLRLEMEASL